jgi:hypothetical protein
MSVDIAGNPWKLSQDGVGTNPVGFSYFNAIDAKNINITKVLTAGNRVYVTDWSGRTVVDFISEPGDTSFRIGNMGFIYGLVVVQFDEGEMTIAV